LGFFLEILEDLEDLEDLENLGGYRLIKNSNHCGAEAVFLEVGVLGGAFRVEEAELAEEFLAETAFAFAVDEDNLGACMAEVGSHDLIELFHLIVEHILWGEAVGVVEEGGDMEVNLD